MKINFSEKFPNIQDFISSYRVFEEGIEQDDKVSLTFPLDGEEIEVIFTATQAENLGHLLQTCGNARMRRTLYGKEAKDKMPLRIGFIQ